MRLDAHRYADIVSRLDLDGIDLTAFRDAPLDGATLRCLRYMHDVEHHTVCYLRDLLASPAHRDPAVTTFLTMWGYEEHWHGEAIGAVLAAHGEDGGAPRVAAMRSRLRGRDRVMPLVHAGVSNLVGDRFVAVHMTWGALNEWTTQAGYARLVARADHPVLTDLLRRIMRQEGRHIDFYASQAEARLAASAGARRLTRTAIRRLWRPVGSGVMPAEEVRFLTTHLFAGDDGRAMADRIDRRLGRLPGLDGLAPVAAAVASAHEAAGPSREEHVEVRHR